MRIRTLLALPLAAAALAGVATLSSAIALDSGFGDDDVLMAQATPPAPPAGPNAGPGPGAGPGARQARDFSPKAMCTERVARKIGMRAYMKAKLDLKADQMTTWNAYEKAADEVSAKDKARCATLPEKMDKPPAFTDRMNRMEERMKDRLASLQAVKAPLQALYATLTAEQKVVFDRPMMGRGMGEGRGFHRHGR